MARSCGRNSDRSLRHRRTARRPSAGLLQRAGFVADLLVGADIQGAYCQRLAFQGIENFHVAAELLFLVRWFRSGS